MSTMAWKPFLAALLGIAVRSVLAGLAIDLVGFGLLTLLAAFSVGGDSPIGTVARVMNAPGFLAAWFSETPGQAQALMLMFGVNWACWSLLSAPVAVLVFVVKRRRGARAGRVQRPGLADDAKPPRSCGRPSLRP
jgi:hypothetical protein